MNDYDPPRITRVEAAVLAGVHTRTINRWSARGLLTVHRSGDFREPAMYDRDEVIRVALRETVDLPLPEGA